MNMYVYVAPYSFGVSGLHRRIKLISNRFWLRQKPSDAPYQSDLKIIKPSTGRTKNQNKLFVLMIPNRAKF